MRKVIRTANAPQPKGVYSQAIVSGDFVFVAGQACVNPKTNEFEYGDIQSETRQTLQNISRDSGSGGQFAERRRARGRVSCRHERFRGDE